MKKTDKLVQLLNSHIEDKDILEVACGGAEFSISASTMAKSVSCIDLDDSRLIWQKKVRKVESVETGGSSHVA